tara:strand:+ start:9420 stop:9572 length:153 start_codon:yes stop_codon:yes gene_type:complete
MTTVDNTENNTEDNCIYFEYKGRRKFQVSREEWEQSWLRWWKKGQESEDK